MDDNNINEELFDHHQWLPDTPSPDMAWSDMLTRLDEAMPVIDAPGKAGKQKLFYGNKLYLIIILLLLLSIKHTKENLNTQQLKSYAAKALPAGEINSGQKPVSGPGKGLPAAMQKGKSESHNLKNIQVLKIYKKADKTLIIKAGETSTQRGGNTIVKKGNVILQDTTIASSAAKNLVLTSKNSSLEKQKPVLLPGDSLQDANEQDDKNKPSVQAGLQWTMHVPISGTDHYFTGPDANEQPWRILLPGIWISFEADKSMLMAELNPFATASFNPKSFYTTIETTDTQTTRETAKLLTKVFGITGSISYQHNIKGNWWAGGGLQGDFWKKGVGLLTVKQHDNTTNNDTSSLQSYVISSDDWKYFSKFQLYLHAQFMYRTNKYQAGLRAGTTFTSLAKEEGAKNLLFTEVFFRLPLLSNIRNAKH